MSDIRFLKLVSGEEVLCEVVDDGKDISGSYTIKNPCSVVPSGPDSMAIIPWMAMGEFEGEVTLAAAHVMTTNTPIDKIIQEYKRIKTGLVVPPTPQLQIAKD